MGTFAEESERGLEKIFDKFKTDVAYTPSGGQAKTVSAVITYGSQPGKGRGSDAYNTDAVMEIMVSEVPLVANGDMVVTGSGTWDVVYAGPLDDGLIWRCEISRRNR